MRREPDRGTTDCFLPRERKRERKIEREREREEENGRNRSREREGETWRERHRELEKERGAGGRYFIDPKEEFTFPGSLTGEKQSSEEACTVKTSIKRHKKEGNDQIRSIKRHGERE